MDRFAQYAMVASDEAIIDAKLDLDAINKLRVGVIWGAGIGGIETFPKRSDELCQWQWNPKIQSLFYP